VSAEAVISMLARHAGGVSRVIPTLGAQEGCRGSSVPSCVCGTRGDQDKARREQGWALGTSGCQRAHAGLSG